MLRLIVWTLVALTVAGCSLFKSNPYAGFVVGDVNEEAQQTPAVILVGDPQVSSRESLINDRMREVDHLEVMIDKSKDVSFEPQLKRDLRVIHALAAQLGISFNPASGAAFDRQEDLVKLRADIEMVKLRNELERLKKLTQETTGDDLKQGQDQGSLPSEPGDSSVEGIKTQLNKAVTAAETLLAEIQKTAAEGRAAETVIKISPEDHFEDLNAYRARLRQRQNEVRLDDVHDADGHALYRLQLTAAVLPGEVKNKFAVLDMEIAPVEATDDELRALYNQWLLELSRRGLRLALSSTSGSGRIRAQWEQVQTELLSKKLVTRVFLRVYVERVRGLKSFTIPLFTYPGNDKTIEKLLKESYLLGKAVSNLEDIIKKQQENKKIIQFRVKKGSCSVEAPDSSKFLIEETYTTKKTYDEIYKLAKSTLDSAASIGVIQGFRSLLEAEGKDGDAALIELREELERFGTVKSDAERVLKIMELLKKNNVLKECFEPEIALVPDKFKERVLKDKVLKAKESKTTYWRGEARTYQAQPTERVQRISSVASAVNSMQLAFSLAALLPGQGIGLDAGAAAAKTAIGMTEATERTPVIIGYTDRQSKDDTSPQARFGYIFGPKAVLNTEDNGLEYRQQARSHPVFADITVPAWWPAIDLKVRSAWVENWHSGTSVLKNSTDESTNNGRVRSIKVRLRPRLADAGPLTQFVLENSLVSDLDAPRITGIYPRRASACADDVVFTVAGENLWRAPVAYLRGKRHESIRVLPDMRGLEVIFNMRDLPKPPDRGVQEDQMTVWTSLGSVSKEVEIVDTRLGAPCLGTREPDGVAASLSPASSRLVGGTAWTIRVNLAKPLPTKARNVKIIYQLFTNKNATPSHEINKSAVFPGRYVEGSATISPPQGIVDEAVNGMPLRVGLSYQTIDSGERYPAWAGRAIVYYVNDAASRFNVDTDEIDGLPGTVTLTSPVKLSEGYPKFVPSRGNFAAAIKSKSQDNAKLNATAKWNADFAKVVVSVQPENDEARKKFLSAACKDETQLMISTIDTSGQSPLVVSNTVKIKKQTAPENCNPQS